MAAANPVDLVTVEQMSEWIPSTGSSTSIDPDIAQQLITSVSRDFVKLIGAKIDFVTGSPTLGQSTLNSVIQFTLTLDGNGSDVLFPPIRPIRSLIALLVNGYAPALNPGYGQPGVAIETDGYSLAFQFSGFGHGSTTTVGWPATGASGCFPMGRRNILLTCTAGYGVLVEGSNPVAYTAPDDLQTACMQTVQLNLMRRDRSGLDSENLQGTASTTYSKLAYPIEVSSVLQKYVRVALGAQS